MERALRLPSLLSLVFGFTVLLAGSPLSAAEPLDVQELTASDGADFDLFGLPVAVDGDSLLAAAKGADAPAPKSGAVYAYALVDDRWVERQKLVASDGEVNDEFGTALAIDGELAVIGAPRDDDLGSESGAAYVFRRGATGWVEEEKLVASDGRELLFFGHKVALDGEVIVVGAPAYAGGAKLGWAYVFRYDGAEWIEEQILEAADGVPGDFFGSAGLAIDGEVILVAAERHVHGPGVGAVYPFRFDGERWIEGPELHPAGGVPSQFGRSVALEDGVAVVGAPSGFAPLEDGVAYAFRLENGRWTQVQQLSPSDPSDLFPWDGFGNALELSCGIIFVSSPYHCHDGPCPGSVYVFRPQGSGWILERELVPVVGEVAYDFFGHSVAASGRRAVVGAPGTNTEGGPDAGVAYAITVERSALDTDCP